MQIQSDTLWKLAPHLIFFVHNLYIYTSTWLLAGLLVPAPVLWNIYNQYSVLGP